jgi:hypothetical protein
MMILLNEDHRQVLETISKHPQGQHGRLKSVPSAVPLKKVVANSVRSFFWPCVTKGDRVRLLTKLFLVSRYYGVDFHSWSCAHAVPQLF